MSPRFNCDILDLRCFVVVHETRSFHRAAKLLDLSQPAFSRRIQRLEWLVGGSLFDRTSRTLTETALGRELLPVARRTVEQLDASLFASANLREPRWVDITIASIPTAAVRILPQAVRQFMRDNEQVRIRILDGSAVETIDLIARGQAEFGLSIESLMPPGLRFERLNDDVYGVACHQTHRLAECETVSWSALGDETLILVHRESRNRTLLESELARHGLSLGWRYEVGHLTTAYGLVEAQVGVAIMPQMMAPVSERSDVVWRPLFEPRVSRTIGVVLRRSGAMHPAALQLLERIRAGWRAGPLSS